MALEIDIDLEVIVRTFAAECAERIADMEQAALALELRPQDENLLEAIFRGAHTLKGNAGSLGYGPLAEFTHGMENLLQEFRIGTVPVSRHAITLMLESVDVLRELVDQVIAGDDTLKPFQKALLKRLEDCHSGIAPGPLHLERENADDRIPAVMKSRTTPVGVERNKTSVVAEHNDTIRVDIRKLDRMLNLAGELTIAQGRLNQVLADGEFGKHCFEAREQLERLSLDLQEEIMKLRMVPVGSGFRHLIRVSRDAAAAAGKEVRLSMEGEDAEIDLSIVEHLKDPLMHMVRNAIDHGIEAARTRRELGKNPCGLLLLKAFQDSGSFVIQLSDDGAGLNRERIIERAQKQWRMADIERVSDQEIYQWIFEPGFSTAPTITDMSGRGVGMDVVRRNIEGLRGTVEVESEAGHGVTVTIRLPLTLAMIQGFSVQVGGDTYLLPLHAVLECLTMPFEECGKGPIGVINLHGEPLPYIRLRDRFEINSPPPPRESIVVVVGNGVKAGLAVDTLDGPRQTVIKPLGKGLERVAGISGSAILGNGRVALIVDVAGLLRDLESSAAGSCAGTVLLSQKVDRE
jgi:two-component system chemotaxis sensor kinase CheA